MGIDCDLHDWSKWSAGRRGEPIGTGREHIVKSIIVNNRSESIRSVQHNGTERPTSSQWELVKFLCPFGSFALFSRSNSDFQHAMGPCLSKSTLSEEDMNYLLGKTHFSKAEIRKWHRGFVKDCPTSQINKKTFLDMYSQYFPDGKAKPFYEHLFRTFDQDNSGNIDFNEFLIAISTTQSGTPEEKLELAFKLYDIDNNGKIEESEMIQIIKAIYLMVGESQSVAFDSPQDRTKSIFEKMDVNKDHVLSKDEFIRGCLEDEQLFSLLSYSEEIKPEDSSD